MKKLLLFIALWNIALVNAQENQEAAKGHLIGVKSGVLFSNRFSNCLFGWNNELIPTIAAGYNGGFTYQYVFQNGLTLGVDMIYSIKRYHWSAKILDSLAQLEYMDLMEFESIWRHHFIEIPLKIGYTTGKKWRYFITGGVAPGVKMLIKIASTITDIPTGKISHRTDEWPPSKFSVSLDAILETGVGYAFNNFLVYVSVNGECSIFPIDDIGYWHICQNRLYSFGINVGVTYKIR